VEGVRIVGPLGEGEVSVAWVVVGGEADEERKDHDDTEGGSAEGEKAEGEAVGSAGSSAFGSTIAASDEGDNIRDVRETRHVVGVSEVNEAGGRLNKVESSKTTASSAASQASVPPTPLPLSSRCPMAWFKGTLTELLRAMVFFSGAAQLVGASSACNTKATAAWRSVNWDGRLRVVQLPVSFESMHTHARRRRCE